MLNQESISAKLVQVRDNNDIDREVCRFNPEVVVTEALWVVPEKFDELHKLHPRVWWVIRGHSEIPFLAQEGIAVDWITRYLRQPNVIVAANSDRSYSDFEAVAHSIGLAESSKVAYLPNYFPLAPSRKHGKLMSESHLDMACLGAIRPLKNQLIQAIAALRFARKEGKFLCFHMNTSRAETGGESVCKNVRALFHRAKEGRLVEHEWLSRSEMLDLLLACDAGMQVSYSETFNLVAAEMVNLGLPVVGSSAIPWLSHFSVADPNDSLDIASKLAFVTSPMGRASSCFLNRHGLAKHCEEAKRIWLEFLGVASKD
jgi:hypothetical protein